ncbi:hypothetical protein [Cupriavidus sp. SK-4]|uniref:hypothetical protein n=1 Tax=Cupriavidus sp. SK-4 TaxID=574750 RepID=UPI00126939EE|nr:hypothetical protein [Cupriavidus sp. SK-4]
MHDAGKTAAMLALASVCCGALAKALTFEEIERADTVSGRYINHLSATEMNAATPPLAHRRCGAVGGAIAHGTNSPLIYGTEPGILGRDSLSGQLAPSPPVLHRPKGYWCFPTSVRGSEILSH